MSALSTCPLRLSDLTVLSLATACGARSALDELGRDASPDGDADGDSDADSDADSPFDCAVLESVLRDAVSTCCDPSTDGAAYAELEHEICDVRRSNGFYVVDAALERTCYESTMAALSACGTPSACDFYSGAQGEGEPCRVDEQCRVGLACEGAGGFGYDPQTWLDGACERIPGVGEPCLPSARCIEVAFCNRALDDWTCHPLLPAGADCSVFDPSSSPCDGGHVCEGGVCVDLPGDGEGCIQGRCAADLYCHAGLCEVPDGTSCRTDADCASGWVCEAAYCQKYDMCIGAEHVMEFRALTEWVYWM